jgi:hypothetical protein
MVVLWGVVVGLLLVVGGLLVFRFADRIVGFQPPRSVPAAGRPGRDGGRALEVALNRAFAIGVVLLGVATVLFSIA